MTCPSSRPALDHPRPGSRVRARSSDQARAELLGLIPELAPATDVWPTSMIPIRCTGLVCTKRCWTSRSACRPTVRCSSSSRTRTPSTPTVPTSCASCGARPAGAILLVITAATASSDADAATRRWLTRARSTPRTDWLELERLGRADVARMIGHRRGATPPSELVDVVVRRSDGNPLLVAALAYVDAGADLFPAGIREMMQPVSTARPDAARWSVRRRSSALTSTRADWRPSSTSTGPLSRRASGSRPNATS